MIKRTVVMMLLCTFGAFLGDQAYRLITGHSSSSLIDILIVGIGCGIICSLIVEGTRPR
jgi:hypothetical protein